MSAKPKTRFFVVSSLGGKRVGRGARTGNAPGFGLTNLMGGYHSTLKLDL